ncbi:hypothetical protein C8J57DRAFT_1538448 [Mycena rebaudengoi]|nr:hypothetical protein C8J57DRAFT_1538448 [Mycena rebaudengoi]
MSPECVMAAHHPASPRQAEQHTPDAAWENTVMALRLGDRKARAPGYISCARQSSSADIAASLGDRSIDSDVAFKRNAASSYVPPHPCDPDRFGFGMWPLLPAEMLLHVLPFVEECNPLVTITEFVR